MCIRDRGKIGLQKGPRLARLAILNKRKAFFLFKEIARRARRARRGIWLAAPPPGRVTNTGGAPPPGRSCAVLFKAAWNEKKELQGSTMKSVRF